MNTEIIATKVLAAFGGTLLFMLLILLAFFIIFKIQRFRYLTNYVYRENMMISYLSQIVRWNAPEFPEVVHTANILRRILDEKDHPDISVFREQLRTIKKDPEEFWKRENTYYKVTENE
jgi:hypothetical protein